jgi:hypothetical protein
MLSFFRGLRHGTNIVDGIEDFHKEIGAGRVFKYYFEHVDFFSSINLDNSFAFMRKCPDSRSDPVASLGNKKVVS